MLGCQIKITFKLRKTKYKEGGPQRGLVELYCQSNGLNEMIYDQWSVCITYSTYDTNHKLLNLFRDVINDF